MSREPATAWAPAGPYLGPYASLVVDLPAVQARWALELSHAIAAALSEQDELVLTVGRAQLHLIGPVRPAGRPTPTGPLVTVPGCFLRRWVRVPVEVELSAWSTRRSELLLRCARGSGQPRWYFAAAAAALRILEAEIRAWAGSAPECPPELRSVQLDQEHGSDR